jgi:hypothetical protein
MEQSQQFRSDGDSQAPHWLKWRVLFDEPGNSKWSQGKGRSTLTKLKIVSWESSFLEITKPTRTSTKIPEIKNVTTLYIHSVSYVKK